MAIRGQHIIRIGTSSILNLSAHQAVRRIGTVGDSSGAQQPSADNNTRVASGEFPEEPTNCCMSGCANCVWIKYAEELINRFEGGGDMARDVILSKVQDPNMKAFLAMELKTMNK